MPAALSNLRSGLAAEIDHLVDGLISGRLSPSEWHNAVLQELADYHSAAYLLGRRLQALDEDGRQLVLRAIANQADFLNGFTDQVEAGALSDARIRARAALYSGSVAATFSAAATWGAFLPFHPCDGGTPCGGHCRCTWQRRGTAWYWVLGAADEHCDGCRQRADGSPYGG